MKWNPEHVRGNQLERLRLRLLQFSSHTPDRRIAFWDGRKLLSGTASKHRTKFGMKLNAISRLRYRK